MPFSLAPSFASNCRTLFPSEMRLNSRLALRAPTGEAAACRVRGKGEEREEEWEEEGEGEERRRVGDEVGECGLRRAVTAQTS